MNELKLNRRYVYLPNKSPNPLLKDVRLTIVVPFYNDQERLIRQLNNWIAYDDLVKSSVDIIIADDGSNPPMASFMAPSIMKRAGLNLKIFRILNDLKWNTPGALNLGISQSQTPWILFMDSDCLMEPDMIYKLITELCPDPLYKYGFHRDRVTNDPIKKSLVRALTCAALVYKDEFLSIGGFDEAFSGVRNTGYGFFDCDFNWRWFCKRQFASPIVESIFIKEYLKEDSVQIRTNLIQDNLSINKQMYRAKQNLKPEQILINNNWLMFDWVLDYESSRW